MDEVLIMPLSTNSSLNGYNQSTSGENESGLLRFSAWYAHVHGYTSVAVCVFGVITNMFNITVLTRKDMASPTNVLLTWLAVSDILTMIPYIPFALHFYCLYSPFSVSPEKNSYVWMMFMLVLISFAATTHTISIWLGVAIAVMRYLQLKSTASGAHANKRRIKSVKRIVAVVYVVSTLGLIPNYLSNELQQTEIEIYGKNSTIYVLKDLKLNSGQADTIVIINVLCYGLFAKMVPCVLMCLFGGALLYNVSIKGKNRQRRLSRMASVSSMATKRRGGRLRTTKMLLTVLILFLITELPQGILIFLSVGVKGFFFDIYIPLGDMMDFIALMNNAINFVLYCTMSNQFRLRFLKMFGQRSYSIRDGLKRTFNLKPPETQLSCGSNLRNNSLISYQNGDTMHCDGKMAITRLTTLNGSCKTETLCST